ncbi:MAG: hypothetical protein GOVbin2833_15 [Prokaryotic dsDNA virus sp.]|nr:MAG: hypothetical protein GOVbin2833_15 [Prokaryotic dsDNA virus sp.]|tara:strand:+ start:16284 stop:16469 length:186 start_codon:yes stop_codon:yes gene_type:complete
MSDGYFAEARPNLGRIEHDVVQVDIHSRPDMVVKANITIEEAKKLASQLQSAIDFFESRTT